jgi:hypothetical protein
MEHKSKVTKILELKLKKKKLDKSGNKTYRNFKKSRNKS